VTKLRRVAKGDFENLYVEKLVSGAFNEATILVLTRGIFKEL